MEIISFLKSFLIFLKLSKQFEYIYVLIWVMRNGEMRVENGLDLVKFFNYFVMDVFVEYCNFSL